MNWNIQVLIICILLAIFLIWQEYRRSNETFLTWRITASIIAVVAIACIILPVTYPGETVVSRDNVTILLTPGFNPDSLTSYKNARIFTAEKAIVEAYPKTRLISLNSLQDITPSVTGLYVLGYGLNSDEWKELGDLPVIFHPTQAPDGIINVSWNQNLKESEQLRIQGRYKNTTSKRVKLVLTGLNTALDTISIRAGSTKSFELNTYPKNPGRAIYNVLAIAGNDTVTNESLPVNISPLNPLKILILTASPDFETRFLKNWLTANGYSAAIRSAISREKFVKDFINMEAVPLDHLSSALFDKFDLVIGDVSVFKSLNGAEGAALKQQVSQKGMGIIIRADSSNKNSSWLQMNFPMDRGAAKDQVISSLIIQSKNRRTAALKIDPVYVHPKNGTQPLVTDEQKHLVVSSAQFGTGRLVFSTLNNTYTWALAGQKDDFDSYWSLLLSKAARKVPISEQWNIISPIPMINIPVQLQLESASQPIQISTGQVNSPPLQNPLAPFEWTGTYWPETQGWRTIKQPNGAVNWFYVYGANEWLSLKASKKIADSRQYLLNKANFNSVTKPIHQKIQIAIPKIYFYMLLLAAYIFLWVEGKSSPNHAIRR